MTNPIPRYLRKPLPLIPLCPIAFVATLNTQTGRCLSAITTSSDTPSGSPALFCQVKPGGYFLSKTVCLKDAPRWMQVMVRVLVAAGIAPQVTLVSRAELTRHLSQAGFDVTETRYFGKKQINPFIVAHKPFA